MKSELEEFISGNREAFDTRMPDPAVLQRIQEEMRKKAQPSEPRAERAVVIPIRILKWAAAAMIVLAGGAAFWMLQPKDAPLPATVTAKIETPAPSAAPATTPAADSEPVPVITEARENPVVHQASAPRNTAIEEENRLHRQLLFARFNNMESPSQRLSAASQAYDARKTDPEIVDALVKMMNSDPSTNVRLAALEALGKFYREPYVKRKLVNALDKQKDPMVQIGLIELLTKMRERSILKELDKIVNDGNAMQAVKDQAYASIFTLRS